MSDLLKRPGKVTVSKEIIEQEPEMVRDILGAILVMSATNDFMTNSVEYKGYSEEFEIVDEGAMMPEYSIDITQEDDDITVEFVKVT